MNELNVNIYEDFVIATKTPFYMFDLDILDAHISKIIEILGAKTELCFAMKANPFLIQECSQRVSKIEVCSMGELEICKKNKIPNNKIILSGVIKTREELEPYFCNKDCEGIVFTIESVEQWNLVSQLSQDYSIKIEVLVRLSSGNQFGMDQETIYNLLVNRTSNSPQIVGIHSYAGTQKKNVEKINQDFEAVLQFILDLEEKFGFENLEMEFGPGLYIDYFQNEEDIYKDLKILAETIRNESKNRTIRLELGRYLVANSGFYATSVVDIKKNSEKIYCLVDGGIHHLSYHGQCLGMLQPRHNLFKSDVCHSELDQKYKVCGALCTESDVLIRDYKESLAIGDIFFFHNVGAYSVTEAPYLFLSRSLPSIYTVKNENFTNIREIYKTSCINSITDLV